MTVGLSPRAQREKQEAANQVHSFARYVCGITLRSYQHQAAEAIIKSVFDRDGKTFILIFSRQSGKDEVLAIVILFLMSRFIEWGCDIVCAQPTFKPQTINAMERLRKRGSILGKHLSRTAGYIMRMGAACTSYFSAEPVANQVGATADRLLIMNEAQDISPAVYDKRFSPMAASGNATRVFSGTSWTSQTLLAREKRAALEAEKQDGVQRVFMVDADQVAKVNKLYGIHVAAEIIKLGRNHPFVRTQYFCEEIDAQAGMFNIGRLALMAGDQEPQLQPIPGHVYAFLIDVAGQDEALSDTEGFSTPGRDSTTLTIVDIDTSTLPTLQAPTYRAVHRQSWTGISHLVIFGQIKALADIWQPVKIVIDATGVGEGLWAMLDKSFPSRVIPVKFSQSEKSEIGWRFLSIIETGRFRLCALTDEVRTQYTACQSEILPGPRKTLRWGVPDGARDATGALIHDDFVLADALVAVLDKEEWVINMETNIIQPRDPFEEMTRNFG